MHIFIGYLFSGVFMHKFIKIFYFVAVVFSCSLQIYSDCGTCDKFDKESPKDSAFIEMKDSEKKVENLICLNTILNKLYLSDEQTKLFYALVKEINRKKCEMLGKMKDVLKEQVEAYEKFKEENIKNVGFTPAVERNVARAEQKGKKLRDNFTKFVNNKEEDLYEIFLTEQIQLLRFILDPNKKEERKNQLLNPVEWYKIKLQEEIKKIDKKHPQPGFFFEFLTNNDILLVVSERINASPEILNPCDDEFKKLEKQVRGLAGDINLLNLINGINFSTHQIRHIIQSAKSYNDLIHHTVYLEDPLENFTVNSLKRFKKTYEKLIASIEKDWTEKNLEKVSKEFQDMRKQICDRLEVNKQKQKKNKDVTQTKYIDEVFEVLFISQKEVLYDYNPCLIPPKNLKDPVRVGQAKDDAQEIRMLENFRSIPDDKWQKNKNSIIDKTIAEIEEKVQLTANEKKEFKTKLVEVIDKVRAMSDVDFELEKKDIAKELAFLDKVEVLKKELKEFSGKENVVCDKIKQFLLSNKIIPLLEIRLQQLKQKQTKEQTNLDELKSPAEKCRDGHCAVKD